MDANHVDVDNVDNGVTKTMTTNQTSATDRHIETTA